MFVIRPPILILTGLAALLASCQQSGLSNEANAATPVLASSNNPIVIELYQSQGCSSCPPANAALNAIAGRKDVIALNFSVTYWDKLGWKDIFGDPAYTKRQYDYARALGNANVYTPQIVINGSRDIVGNKPGELAGAVAKSKAITGGPTITTNKGSITVGAGKGSAHVWLVRYDPRIQNVAVKAGENRGRTLPHRNIVRQLVKLGSWNGTQTEYRLPQSGLDSWKTVILVQTAGAGPILSTKLI